MKKILLLGSALLLTTACSKNLKHKLGLTETVPDEYQVKHNKPLEVPPFYEGSAKPKTEKKKKGNFSDAEEALLKELK